MLMGGISSGVSDPGGSPGYHAILRERLEAERAVKELKGEKYEAITAEEVEHWACRANPREQIVYFRGPRLIRTPGVEAMTKLHDDGEVILNWRRVKPGLGEWIATRRADPEKPTPRLPDFLRRTPVSDTRDDKERVLAVLKRHANLKKPCPTNHAIAAQAGLKSTGRAAYMIRLLTTDKEIRVETNAQTGFRVVTIISSGRKTAPAGAA